MPVKEILGRSGKHEKVVVVSRRSFCDGTVWVLGQDESTGEPGTVVYVLRGIAAQKPQNTAFRLLKTYKTCMFITVSLDSPH